MSKTEIRLKIRILICDRKNQIYSQMKYSEISSLTRRWDQMFQFFVHLIDDGLFSFNLSSHSGNITLPGINKLAQIFDMPLQNFKFFSSLPNFSFFLRNFLIILGDLIGLLRDLKISNKFCVMKWRCRVACLSRGPDNSKILFTPSLYWLWNGCSAMVAHFGCAYIKIFRFEYRNSQKTYQTCIQTNKKSM